jgi:hypothetical protein
MQLILPDLDGGNVESSSEFYANGRRLRISVTIPGSIGSGSVPVIPYGDEEVPVVEGIDVDALRVANAGTTGTMSAPRTSTDANLKTASLSIGSLLFERISALRWRLVILQFHSD